LGGFNCQTNVSINIKHCLNTNIIIHNKDKTIIVMMTMVATTIMKNAKTRENKQKETKATETMICLLTTVKIFLQNPADHVDKVTGIVG